MRANCSSSILALMLILTQAVLAANADKQYKCEPYWQPRSIAETKRHAAFIGLVPVKPDHFMWEGHSVVVSESWLARFSDTDHAVYFKCKIDGDRDKEAAIYKEERKALAFKLIEPKREALAEPLQLDELPPAWRSGEVIHYCWLTRR